MAGRASTYLEHVFVIYQLANTLSKFACIKTYAETSMLAVKPSARSCSKNTQSISINLTCQAC